MAEMEYDREAILELCSKIDLLEYASKTIEFEYVGSGSYAAHCPRHIDKTPSLFITPEKNVFHCFSCGCGGNIISWLITFEHMKYEDAVKKVVELAGVDISNIRICSAMKIYREVYKSLQSATMVEREIEREFLDESEIEKYKDEVPEEWVAEGIKPEIMKKYNIRIDDDYNRIVYPVYDSKYRLIGFKGRTRYQNWKELGIRSKYTNYQKIGTNNYFQGMKENHKSIIAHNEVIVFEGIKSVMKADGWGMDYCVSSETSTVNDEQILLLIKMNIRNVVFAYDNDVSLEKIMKATKKLRRYTNVYAVMDRRTIRDRLLTGEKMSPVDEGEEVWKTLYRERVKL